MACLHSPGPGRARQSRAVPALGYSSSTHRVGVRVIIAHLQEPLGPCGGVFWALKANARWLRLAQVGPGGSGARSYRTDTWTCRNPGLRESVDGILVILSSLWSLERTRHEGDVEGEHPQRGVSQASTSECVQRE